MKTIEDKDAVRLASIIYIPELPNIIKKIQKDNEKNNISVEMLVEELEEKLEEELQEVEDSEIIGAEMNRVEFLEVLEQIKSSEDLMSLEIVNYENTTPVPKKKSEEKKEENLNTKNNKKKNTEDEEEIQISFEENTDFRAMTLVDPKGEIEPVIVFRGTNGNGQWDDNLAAIYSSQTPSQKEAVRYVANSGLDHVTLVGHSKGGNLAASCAYLLPEGMVDKVYSLNGQGASKEFLERIPSKKQERAKSIIYNINEYRDVVSQLLNKTGAEENTIYFNSGLEYKDTEGGKFNAKMYFFHPHKPNYYLLETTEIVKKSYPAARLAKKISNWNLIDQMPAEKKIAAGRGLASCMHTKRSKTQWNKEYWTCVLEAEEVYDYVIESREEAIIRKIMELYQIDFMKENLEQEENSYVVDGAIISCFYSSNIGRLEIPEENGSFIADKPIASKKDNILGKNIQMEEAVCIADTPIKLYKTRDKKEDKINRGTEKCNPEIVSEWLLTEEDKVIYIEGEEIEAVLKKSVIGCCKGGILTVEENGQLGCEEYKGEKKKNWNEELMELINGGKRGIEKGYEAAKEALEKTYETTKETVEYAYDTVKEGVEYVYEVTKEALDYGMEVTKETMLFTYNSAKDIIETTFHADSKEELSEEVSSQIKINTMKYNHNLENKTNELEHKLENKTEETYHSIKNRANSYQEEIEDRLKEKR